MKSSQRANWSVNTDQGNRRCAPLALAGYLRRYKLPKLRRSCRSPIVREGQVVADCRHEAPCIHMH